MYNALDRIYALTVLLAVSFVVSIAVWHVHVTNRTYSQISSPVRLAGTINERGNPEYKVGETVSGFFVGQLFTEKSPTVLRKVQCDTQTFSLLPSQVLGVNPETIRSKKAPIFVLESSSLENSSTIEPDTNCIVAFQNTYCESFLGITACNSKTRYYTEPFDIIAG